MSALTNFVGKYSLLDMSWIEIIFLICSGLLVGFINTLAGGGTVISLSVFMFMGLPIDVANGTNRIAVIFQNITSTYGFYQKKVMNFKKGLSLALPTVLGSVIGAQMAVNLDQDLFKKAIAVVMIVMVFFMIFKPQKFLKGDVELQNKKINWITWLMFFLIGVYGGLFHVGVGYFLLAAIVLGSGFDLVHANALKVLIVLAYSIVALVVFVINDSVDWQIGLIHSIGNVVGAWIASHMAVEKGANFVRWIMIVVIIFIAGEMFNLYEVSDLLRWIEFQKSK